MLESKCIRKSHMDITICGWGLDCAYVTSGVLEVGGNVKFTCS